ncbi:hypothetical protein [Paenibacillus brevis]|uniref:LexA repressor DNA-binding domain-containing protein n=1 Tax=Paenibacillus brevis TaxID=2841508 RepID=A0ABS6FRR7_9BACL|nr:hypothetical protein [Paenibacillus brevis]MBU5672664.1 hypothetical protein [Paenibacillus brevis]
MLDDLERKLLRVLSNYRHSHRSMPIEKDLVRMMGRKMPVINRGLLGLEQKGYIEWRPPYLDTIRVKEAWDRDGIQKEQKQKIDMDNNAYFTQY